ncbi:methylmalonyl-CoA mutase family protein [Robertmurraya sp.]|uniref:methylmalonyl-CoA mutase family protein n=1 Tax=Robertmurraya sp. TaxID=2837525 RepID=UPI003704A895
MANLTRHTMQIKDMKHASFPLWQEEDWTEKSEQSLKGKKVEHLIKHTYEQIKMKPLYFKKEQHCSQFPGIPDYRRGIDSYLGEKQPWRIAQTIHASTGNELKNKMEAAIKGGQSAVSFSVQEDISYQSIFEAFTDRLPVCVHAKKGHQSKLLSELSSVKERSDIQGFIATDPLAQLASDGYLEEPVNDFYDELAKNIQFASQKFPELKTILVDTTPYHNGGANAVQEIAISLATAVFHLEELSNRNIPIETILSKYIFHFSVGANFFMEIAKLRAARMLWSEIVKAYGGSNENQKMVISAQTSSFTKTVYDPYVNLLRSSNEAFAAVIGGVQYLHVSPFNELEGNGAEFSERIARNTQLILKEEALICKTHDPAGGSWYIEELTDEIAKKAWELFLQIDDYGGMLSSLVDGDIQSQISKVLDNRKNDSFTRKQSIVGTNMYANLEDQPLKLCMQQKTTPETVAIKIPELKQSRLSEPYETLRRLSEKLERQPVVGVICIGGLKQFKPQADFIAGFLAPGGIVTEKSEGADSWEQIQKYIESSNHSTYCLCGAYGEFEELGLTIVKEFHKNYPEKRLYLAGLPEAKDVWLQSGVTDFFHRQSNCYDSLSSLLTEMEETTHA